MSNWHLTLLSTAIRHIVTDNSELILETKIQPTRVISTRFFSSRRFYVTERLAEIERTVVKHEEDRTETVSFDITTGNRIFPFLIRASREKVPRRTAQSDQVKGSNEQWLINYSYEEKERERRSKREKARDAEGSGTVRITFATRGEAHQPCNP